MIIRPLQEFKRHRSELPDHVKNMVDAMIYDMLNMTYKIREVGYSTDNQFFWISIKGGKTLQFIPNIEEEELLVLLYDGIRD